MNNLGQHLMSRNMTSWKLLEDMMLELKKSGVAIPPKTVEDLRSAKSMLKLGCMPGSGDAIQKAGELMANVEAYLVTEGQTAFGEDRVDEWLRKLEEANIEICAEPHVASEHEFVVGVPRDQKWVRIEPIDDLPAERISVLAAEEKLEIKPQKGGKLLVHGPVESIKGFIKRMTAEAAKK